MESEFYLMYTTFEPCLIKIKANINELKYKLKKILYENNKFSFFEIEKNKLYVITGLDWEIDTTQKDFLKLIKKYQYKKITTKESTYLFDISTEMKTMFVPLIHKKFKKINQDIIREAAHYI
jgi:hypothetical protein